MDIGSLFLIAALFILVAMFIMRPLLEEKSFFNQQLDGKADHDISELLAERDQILNALHEIDLDHTLGIIPAEDYAVERTKMLEKGTQILRELEQLQLHPSSAESQMVNSSSFDVHTELQKQARPVSSGGPIGQNSSGALPNGRHKAVFTQDDELEVMLARRRRVRQDKAAGFCPNCGHTIQKTDQFCPKCGKKLDNS